MKRSWIYELLFALLRGVHSQLEVFRFGVPTVSFHEIAYEARLQVLEIAVAAVVAQLPQPSLEEVVGLLTYVAGISQEAAQVADSDAAVRCSQLQHWAEEMLNRVMTSRKSGRVTDTLADDKANQRFSPGAHADGDTV